MKRLLYILPLAFILLSACHRDEVPEAKDYGYLSLNLSLTITSEPANGRTLAVNTDDFRVTIFAADGTEVMVFDPFSTAPAEVQLPTGEYYVEAHSNNLVDAAFENPYYFGRSDNFTIDKEELKSIDIEAELANTKVAINYSANVVNTFHSYTGTVTVVSSGASLFYGQGETREGYFLTFPLAVEVNLSYTKLDGTTIDRTFTASIADPQPKTLYNINVDATLEDGKVVFNIIVDEGFDTVDVELGDGSVEPNENWSPGADWIDTRDGEVYRTAQAGSQVWLAENLRYEAEPSWVMNNNIENEADYGRLYLWATVMNGESPGSSVPSGVQGICPAGWHIPSNAELTQLFDEYGGAAVAGSALRETGTDHWNSPNANATNASGLSFRGSGWYQSNTGTFHGFGQWGHTFSSEEIVGSGGYQIGVFYANSAVSVGYATPYSYALPVRCIKD
ncbi:DUF4493 domain-containing protein [Imperialibacter roseus]|uniref:DUF4493 domain-containing protein n=1 Tax=Imperialibacter roseus TaxID=1324217 RepID=A0ABZ0IW64_9BACT|nr:DUF4493 domain-containing protein [Imperialibacter roseus]WOK09288.1 DUF4493 domain-containing protein [Imperialibacter roseus]